MIVCVVMVVKWKSIACCLNGDDGGAVQIEVLVMRTKTGIR